MRKLQKKSLIEITNDKKQPSLNLSKKELVKEIKRLEKEMLKNARELEFEKAALSRDKLEFAKTQFLDL